MASESVIQDREHSSDLTARIVVKRIAQLLFLLLAGLCWIIYRLESLICGKRRAFGNWSQVVALMPGIVGVYLRWGFYFLTLRRCAWDVTVEFGTLFSSPQAELGRHVYIGAYCVLGDVALADHVRIASGVSVPSGADQHLEDFALAYEGPNQDDGSPHLPTRNNRYRRLTIGSNTWIGERAVVMAEVGADCIIGAGAVVTKPIPDRSLAVGVPARVIRTLDSSTA